MKLNIEIDFSDAEESTVMLRIYEIHPDIEPTLIYDYEFIYISEMVQYLNGYLCAMNSVKCLSTISANPAV